LAGTPLSFVHILLLLAAAFLVGLRIYRETRPKDAVEDEQTQQLNRLAKAASIGFVVILVTVIVGMNLRMFHAVKVIQ
jgi:hypothetical protein